jgi:hypothetical protein
MQHELRAAINLQDVAVFGGPAEEKLVIQVILEQDQSRLLKILVDSRVVKILNTAVGVQDRYFETLGW